MQAEVATVQPQVWEPKDRSHQEPGRAREGSPLEPPEGHGPEGTLEPDFCL